LKAGYHYFERRIAEVNGMLSDPKLEEVDRAMLWEMRRRLYEKRRKHRDQLFANAATDLARRARALNVSAVFIGGLRGIAR